MKKYLLLLLPLILLISCGGPDKETKKEILLHKSASEFNQYVLTEKNAHNEKVQAFVKNMPLEDKIAQLFIENLEGNLSFRSFESIGQMNGTSDSKPLVAGGYLYFSYNIADSREAMKAFNDSVMAYCDKYDIIHPFLSVDQEGGWVTRLKRLNDKLPSNESVANTMSVASAYELYSNQAKQMTAMGFNMNLAPVIEVCTDDNREFLDGRSFGDLEQVLTFGRACINAYENNGIATVVKHFPGNTNTDPHTGLPEITLSKEELFESIESFRLLLNTRPAAILMSHARTKALDPGVPACLSSVWVTDLLRKEWGYEGLIISDDIFMGALADNGYPPEFAVVKAIEAGIDCIMISEKRFAKAASVLYKKYQEEEAFAEKIDQAVLKVLSYKEASGLWSLAEAGVK
ncbi:MAG: glycoside hydrolase family 3 protein [Treponema sp.]|nr:glycoside hydrolase family 3 protein [Treponema sp.]